MSDQPPPPAPEPQRYDRSPAFWVASAAIVGMIVGAVGPWATVLNIDVNGTGSGRDGTLVIILAAISAVLLIVFATTGRRWPLIVTVVMAILSVVICIVDIGNVNDVSTSTSTALAPSLGISVGWGLYVSLAASAVLAIAALATRISAPPR
jgi:hypothetical protein